MKRIVESSLNDLYQSAVDAFPHTMRRQHSTQPIVIHELTWTPFVGMKTLFIKGVAKSEEKQYDTIILFKNVNYDGNEVRIIASDDQEYAFNKLSIESTDTIVRCNCQDFYWRFAWYNHLDKSLYGKPHSKYESKGGYPANPFEMPGMCKHLMKTAKVLKEAGIFQS